MSDQLTNDDHAAIGAIVSALEAAWNSGDGEAFAAPMSEDADFVTVRAEHYRGRKVIAQGHDAIFRTIYAGSRIQCTLDSARLLDQKVALVHVKSVLDAPSGPLAGRHEALFSVVLLREPGGWRITAFHNTQAPPTSRP